MWMFVLFNFLVEMFWNKEEKIRCVGYSYFLIFFIIIESIYLLWNIQTKPRSYWKMER